VNLAEDAAAAASAPWIGARDLAILLLLYGAGLRVAEALSLTADVLPVGSTLKVTGKRSKTRIVPAVAAVRARRERRAGLAGVPRALPLLALVSALLTAGLFTLLVWMALKGLGAFT